MRYLTVVLCATTFAAAAERASYDAGGRLVALISDGEELEISSAMIAVLPTGKRVPLRVQRERRPPARASNPGRTWSGSFELPDGGRGRTEWKAVEDDSGIQYTVQLQAESLLDVKAIEWVLDLPRQVFVEGELTPQGVSQAVPLAIAKPATLAVWSAESPGLRIAGPQGGVTLDIAFDRPAAAAVVDRWTGDRRTYQLQVAIHRGEMAASGTASLTATLRFADKRPAAPVRLTLDTAKPRFRFDGFGGNYCWNNLSPVSRYTLDNLKLGWARTEMKIQQWDKQKASPGPELKADFEVMRRFQQMGVPYVISIWWLPERFYTDPHEKPRSAHFRLIDPDKWGEMLDLIGSYLLYAKKEYGVEPDMFSFNEANIGIYVGQSPEAHTLALKRIGKHFQSLGLKTKMLLGDATGPRDTHKFVLDAAADPEALEYVAAIGFHSWGGGTAEQYKAWGDVAEWLNLPLLVTELGVDASAYMGRAWDSFHYGLREARMTQELLLHARPQGTQFWQFTNDYALASEVNGKVEPSPRFYLMKHFTNLTPQKSEALTASSDQGSVLITAFRKDSHYVLHILNRNGARQATLEGLPDGEWKMVVSTEPAQFQERAAGEANQGKLQLDLPGRSLVTLMRQ